MFNFLYSLLVEETSVAGNSSVQATGFAGFISRYGFLILILVLFVVMIFFTGRQRKKQEKEMNDKLSSLKVGDKIETIGRIYGTIVSVNEDENTLIILTGDEAHPGYVKIDKMAVYRTIVDYPVEPETETVTEETTEQPAPATEDVFEEKTVSENEETAAEDKTE